MGLVRDGIERVQVKSGCEVFPTSTEAPIAVFAGADPVQLREFHVVFGSPLSNTEEAHVPEVTYLDAPGVWTANPIWSRLWLYPVKYKRT